jgi:lysophospholipase L1-like esterase
MEWYEEEVQRAEQEITNLDYHPRLLFYGSSSIRLWENLYDDFQSFQPVNLGFGGSTLEACVHFFQRIMEPFNPKQMVVYAGDNDLGDGKKPDEVHSYFIQLCESVNECFGEVPMLYISIKPSLHRWQINDAIQYTNLLIQQTITRNAGYLRFVDVYSRMIGTDGLPVKEFYAADGLHLSKEGYELWKNILLTHISFNDDSSLISAS